MFSPAATSSALRSKCTNVLMPTRIRADNGKAIERIRARAPGDGQFLPDCELVLSSSQPFPRDGPLITQCPTHGGGGGRAPGGGGGGGGERKGGRSSRAHDDGGDSYYPSGGGAGGSGGGGKPPPKGAGPSLETDGGHRASCHRCGNLRKRNVKCVNCPHIFCQRCAEKEVLEYGADIFGGGCPVCKYLCCCNDPRDAQFCPRLFHCYKKCPATKNSGGTGSGDAMNANTDRQPQTDVAEAARVVSALIEGPPASRPPTLRHLIGSQPLPQVGATSRTPPGAASSMGSGGRGGTGGRGGGSAHSLEDRETAPGFVPPPANAVARRALGGEGGSSSAGGGARGFSPSSAAGGAGGAFESPTARGTPRSATSSALALLAGSALTDGHGKPSPRGQAAAGGRSGGGRGAGGGKRYGTRGVSLDFSELEGAEAAGEEGEGYRAYAEGYAEGEEGGAYGGAGEHAAAGEAAEYPAAAARAGGHAGEGEAEGVYEYAGAGGAARSRRALKGRSGGGGEAAEGHGHGRQGRQRDRRGSSLAHKVTGGSAGLHPHGTQGPQASELMLGPDAAMSTRGGSGLLPLDSVPRASPVGEGSGELLAGARLQMSGLPSIKGSAGPVPGLLASPSPPGSAYLAHLRPADAASAMAADRGFVPDKQLLRAGDASRTAAAAAAAAAMANLPGMGPLAAVPGKGPGALGFAWQPQAPLAVGISAHLQPQGSLDIAGKFGGAGDRRPDLSFLDRATAGGPGVGSSAASTLSAGTAETLRDSRATTATEGGESDDGGEGGHSGRLSVARAPGAGGERVKPLLQTDGLGPSHPGDRGYLPTGIPGGGGGSGPGATGGKPVGVSNLLAPFGGGGVNVGSGIGAAMSPFPVVGGAQPADPTAPGSGGSAGSGTFPFNVALPTPLEAGSMSSGPAGTQAGGAGGAAGAMSSAAHPFLFPSMTDLFASHVKGFDAFRLGGGAAPQQQQPQQQQQLIAGAASAAPGSRAALSEQLKEAGLEVGVVRPSPTPAGFGAAGGALNSPNHAGRADVGGGGRGEAQRQVSGAVRKRGSEDAPASGSGTEQQPQQQQQLRITSPALGPSHQRRRTDDGSGGASMFVPFSRSGSLGNGSGGAVAGPSGQVSMAASSARSLPRSADDASAVEETGADDPPAPVAHASALVPKAAGGSLVSNAPGSTSDRGMAAPSAGSDAATASTLPGPAPASHLLSQSAHPFAATFSPTTDLLGSMRGQAPPWVSHVSRPASATEGGLPPRAPAGTAAAGVRGTSLGGVAEGSAAPFTPGIPLPGAFSHTFTPTPHDSHQ